MRPVKQSVLPRLALLALIWGSSFLWIKLADRGFSPAEVTFARLALGAAVLFPVTAARREAMPRSTRTPPAEAVRTATVDGVFLPIARP